MKLSGKMALVTGAARGIGYGCALELARAGADVVINDRATTREAQAAVAEIQALGRRSALAVGDAFEREGCQQVVTQALAALGRLDILVSNPARSHRAAFLNYDPDQFDRVLRGTLYGGFYMSQLVAQHMVQRGGGGKLLFISSVQARMPMPNSVAYNAGKSGLIQMAFTIANELLPHRINVNVIEPGWIDTPGEHEAFGSSAIADAAPSLPWGRLGTPADIGKAAVFLCSDDADYITATSLLVDGGFSMRGARAE